MTNEEMENNLIVFGLESHLVNTVKTKPILADIRLKLDELLREYKQESTIEVITMPTIMGNNNDRRIFVELTTFFTLFLYEGLAVRADEVPGFVEEALKRVMKLKGVE